MTSPKFLLGRENPRQMKILSGKSRTNPRFGTNQPSPDKYFSTACEIARLLLEGPLPRVRLHSRRRDHHVSLQQPVLNPAVQLGRMGCSLDSRPAAMLHSMLHTIIHTTLIPSFMKARQEGWLRPKTALQPVIARLRCWGQVCS